MENNNIEEMRILLQQYERRMLSERIKRGIRKHKMNLDEKK